MVTLFSVRPLQLRSQFSQRKGTTHDTGFPKVGTSGHTNFCLPKKLYTDYMYILHERTTT